MGRAVGWRRSRPREEAMTPGLNGIRMIAAACAAGAVVNLPAQCFAANELQQPAGLGREMIAILPALRPHSALGDQTRLWAPFIGTWDCDYTFYLADGNVRHAQGELDFGWILDGRAIQDLWITYPKTSEEEREIGTSIRFFDDKSRTWRVVFVSPKYNAIVTVQGGVEGDRIVLKGEDVNGGQRRWSFNDIKEDSFTWRGEKSRDGGKTWRLEEEHHMRRRPPAEQGSR